MTDELIGTRDRGPHRLAVLERERRVPVTVSGKLSSRQARAARPEPEAAIASFQVAGRRVERSEESRGQDAHTDLGIRDTAAIP